MTIPLRFVGDGTPAALDTTRSPEIVTALRILLGVSGVAVLWLFVRETLLGRFAALPVVENEAWLREHVLAYPAEVIGAAWDDGIGSPEVVALLARMVSEGKLESDVASKSSMALRLTVDRESLDSYERKLVDKLFFNGRVKTNTELVKQHYREKGFNPVEEIREGVAASLDALLPPARMAVFGFVVGILFLLACGLLAAVGAVAWFLWSYVGLGFYDASPSYIAAATAMGLAALFSTVGAMRSRQGAAGIGFRRRLTAARAFFARELAAERPALKDEWFPWMLAFGLGRQMDDWSVQHASPASGSRTSTMPSSSWSSGTGGESASGGWSGFAGGRSGGAGAGAMWASAAGSIAAGVSPPSSSGSSGGGGSSGGSSSGGSSGGGGGGGW